MMYDVIIVGAGAAGLFAAANLEPGTRAMVLEKGSSAGKKLLIAGSGQCNITHGGQMRDFLSHYGSKGKTIRPILYQFGNRAVMDYFTRHSVPVMERDDGKVFPRSMKAPDILGALISECEKNCTEIVYNAPVTGIRQGEKGEGDFVIAAGAKRYEARRVIVAAGGRSYPATGSDGSIMPVLQSLGQPITEQVPALVPVFTHSYPYGALAGASARDIRVSVISREGTKAKKRGDMLFTHRGLSGPVILELSRYVRQGDALSICYLPGLDSGIVYGQISEAARGSKKQFATLMGRLYGDIMPRRLVDILSRRAGISPSVSASKLSGGSIKTLAELMTGDVHQVSGTGGFNVAMVTAGGVALDAVKLDTLESKTVPGLYFAGEVLDVDGDTGGYNIQFAFSSGYLAAKLK